MASAAECLRLLDGLHVSERTAYGAPSPPDRRVIGGPLQPRIRLVEWKKNFRILAPGLPRADPVQGVQRPRSTAATSTSSASG
jgi:hypothetical protein